MVSVQCDNEIFGSEAGKLLSGLSDNAWYDRTKLDLNNISVEISDMETVRQLYLWAYSSDGDPDDGIIWTEMEFSTYFTEEEIEQVNAALLS